MLDDGAEKGGVVFLLKCMWFWFAGKNICEQRGKEDMLYCYLGHSEEGRREGGGLVSAGRQLGGRRKGRETRDLTRFVDEHRFVLGMGKAEMVV